MIYIEVFTVLLIALAWASTVAHALELPGKLRLDKPTYFAVQHIYYPGFTVAGGIGEVGGIIVTLVLVLATPGGTEPFWLALVALVGMIAMHGVYWVFVHPVNRYWLGGQPIGGLGGRFFGLGVTASDRNPDWTRARDRWEYSHVIRAALTSVSLVALLVSIVLRRCSVS